MSDNVIQSPYCIASRQIIAKLVQAGYLKHSQRYDAEAVSSAINQMKKRLDALFKDACNEDGSFPAA
jgi:hypothetical protein